MRVLLAVAPWSYGQMPIRQALLVADALVMRGHEAVILPRSNDVDLVKSTNHRIAECLNCPSGGKYPEPPPIFFSDFLIFGGFDSLIYINSIIAHERQLLRALQPDVVVSIWQITLAISCKLEGIPLLSFAIFPDHPAFLSPIHPREKPSPGIVEETLNSVIRPLGWKDVKFASDLIFQSSSLVVCPIPAWLDEGFANISQRVEYASMVRSSSVTEPDLYPEQHIVVYLPQPRVINQVLPLLADLSSKMRAQLHIVGVKENSADGRQVWIESSKFETHLKGAYALVCHGGYGSVLSALALAVPIIAIPGTDAEREYTSRCVARSGVGVHVQRIDKQSISYALKRCSKSSLRNRCCEASIAIAAEDGPRRIVELCEELDYISSARTG